MDYPTVSTVNATRLVATRTPTVNNNVEGCATAGDCYCDCGPCDKAKAEKLSTAYHCHDHSKYCCLYCAR